MNSTIQVRSSDRMRRLACVLAAIVLNGAAGLTGAQSTYPTKPVRLIVPVTTGGPSDLVARILGERLSASFGQPFVVENRPGASQVVGAEVVAKAPRDGYTLLQAAANMAINPVLMTNLPFDTMKDFAPVSLTHITPYVFVVPANSPIKSIAELLKFARENADKATYATTGPGSPQQLATLLLAQMQNLPVMTEVQYKGSSAAHPDLIAGRVHFMIDPLAAAAGHIKSGTLRALAVSTPQRNSNFPQVPTAMEAGVPGYDFASWGGIFAPGGTPTETVTRLNAELVKLLSADEMRKRLDGMGLVAKSSTPEEFRDFVQAEIVKWRGVLQKKP